MGRTEAECPRTNSCAGRRPPPFPLQNAMNHPLLPTRRALLSLVTVGAASALGARAAEACGCEATTPDIEGPYYLPGAPRRSALLEPGMEGTALELTGVVRAPDCGVAAGALLEFWQADARGRYDGRGMRMRGVVQADARGAFALRTIVPGRYLNGDRYRPAHLHVKVRHASAALFTTQLYFAGDPYNAGDPWFDATRALQLAPDHGGFRASPRIDLPG